MKASVFQRKNKENIWKAAERSNSGGLRKNIIYQIKKETQMLLLLLIRNSNFFCGKHFVYKKSILGYLLTVKTQIHFSNRNLFFLKENYTHWSFIRITNYLIDIKKYYGD
ncbi:hypothetical protein EDEG_03332 [Edhazardia aedis USNM 41457]|uniref:Uncharacterized protein n=1 Tax=Edhazardia aedis (strain USNM 41457) TaxID=1003232 RepID=J9D3U5_EDHAE|nr:hypothetical protein EDEG_03332 [Edhazardia aedis USNM 41457]|eukprot:EJW02214.1 hypothetical protein EDEG_03332 [Edhazardia aedis USNM 41457]